MKSKTIWFFGLFLVLLVIVLVVHYLPQTETIEQFKLAGFMKEGEKATDDNAVEKTGPIDRMELEYQGQSIKLARIASGEWKMDKPEWAMADEWQVRQIINSFRDTLESVFSTKADQKDLTAFGLDEKNRIRVKLFEKDKVFASLFIGHVETPEEGGEGDTFIQIEGDEKVHRISGHNLRRPFDSGLSKFRQKKLLNIDGDEIAEILISDPSSASEKEIQLKAEFIEKAESVQAPETEKKKDEKKFERKWKFIKPQGLTPGEIDSYTRSFAGLSAQEFLDKPPQGEDTGLNDNSYSIAVTMKDGKNFKLVLGKEKDNAVYGRIDSRDEIFKVSKYSLENIRKNSGDLRDKRIFTFKTDEINAIKMRFEDSGKPYLNEIKKTQTGWASVSNPQIRIGEEPVNNLLRDIDSLRIDRYLTSADLKGKNTGIESVKEELSVILNNGNRYSLSIGNKLEGENEKFYAKAGSNEFFVMQSYMINKFKKKTDDLRNRKVFAFKTDDIDKIEMRHNDETTLLVRKAEKKDEWKALKPKESESLKQDLIKTIVNTLAGIQLKEFVADKKPGDAGIKKGAFELVVILKNGSSHSLTISDEKKDNGNYAITATESEFKGILFTLNTYQVNNIRKHLAELQ
jgi:hypothetical protein